MAAIISNNIYQRNILSQFRRKATLSIIAVNVAVFLVALTVDWIIPSAPAKEYLPLSADIRLTLIHPWTPLTYMVTHFSVLHILFNMLWLYWFGIMSENSVGAKSVIRTYLIGGLSGALMYIIAAMIGVISQRSDVVGASASVLCIMTATALRNPDMEVRLLLAGSIRIKWFALICILLALLGAGGGNSGGVVAHIGGIISGAIIGWRQRGVWQRISLKLRMRINRRRIKKIHPAIEEAKIADNPHQRLDQLLDKIRVSGYGALTKSERDELSRLSEKL